MSLSRFLKYINLLIGIAVAVCLGLAYWFVYRPLPRTSGRVSAPLTSAASVLRDGLGVPHVVAESEEDALFLQGYVTAQDRLWQMDAARRRAGGEMAEILGWRAVPADREARRMRMRRIAEQQYRVLPAEDRAVFAAYARGVNFFLETHRDRLPVEFALLRYDPRPWSVIDSILVGLEMFYTLCSTWQDEILKQRLLAEGDAEKVRSLFPLRAGSEVAPGSNAWALSGKWTRSGLPLLTSDPHLQFSLPSPWYQIHLRAADLNVSGVSLPGLPGVIIGHNERIAWGATNLHFDVQDLYIEKFDARTGRYAFRGGLEEARLEREVFPVKGGEDAHVSTWVTRHGPILASEGEMHYAMRWTAAEPSGFVFPFLELNRARNWVEFTSALARFPGPAQNFVYADVDGNIGYQAAGRLPVRKSHDGDVPVDGASGEFEWDGFIPFDQLPSAYNPPSGMIVSANQNPFPEDTVYRINGDFAAPYRARRIHDLLEARKGWQAGELLAVQTDIYSAFCHFLARQVVAAYDARGIHSPDLAGAVEQLRNWDGRMERDKAAPLIAVLLFRHLRKAVAENVSPGSGLAYDSQMAPAVIEQLLCSRPKDWFRDYDQLLLLSFVDAIEEGRRMQGDQAGKWNYGRHAPLVLAHPIVGSLPLIGKYFRIGPAPMSGSSTTVNQMTPRLGPSMRMVVDLSDWDRSLQNITLGQSGQIFSAHYKDQWMAYRSGASFPMEFDRIDVKDRLEFTATGK